PPRRAGPRPTGTGPVQPPATGTWPVGRVAARRGRGRDEVDGRTGAVAAAARRRAGAAPRRGRPPRGPVHGAAGRPLPRHGAPVAVRPRRPRPRLPRRPAPPGLRLAPSAGLPPRQRRSERRDAPKPARRPGPLRPRPACRVNAARHSAYNTGKLAHVWFQSFWG